MRTKSRARDEAGVALVTALLSVLLISGIMAGMFAAIQADQRGSSADRDQTQAYAAAHAGLEKLTSSLATLFVNDVSPSGADVNLVASTPPTISGFTFKSPGGVAGSGYRIDFTADGSGNPQAIPNADITTGPFAGFKGLITPYTMTVTAVSNSGGSEVRLRRGLQTVAVPVFQFGIFSNDDLTIFAGGGFDFGGRVHSNGNFFVGAQTGSTVRFFDRITAVGEIVRTYTSNGVLATATSPTLNGTVLFPTSPSTNLAFTQTPNMGSVIGMPGTAANTNWPSISNGTYKSYVRTGLTGARTLNLPLVSQGAMPVDLIRRPALGSNEHLPPALVYNQRYYSQASLRILLSDRIADFTTLPTVTATPPVLLDGDWAAAPPAGYGPVSAVRPPVARSIGPASTVTATGSLYAGGVSQIYVANTAAAIPNLFKLPQLTVQMLGFADQVVTCQGKSGPTAVAAVAPEPAYAANSFFGCAPALAARPAGATITAVVNGQTVTANSPAAIAAGATVITVGANQTAPFSANLFWMNNPNATIAGTSVPVQCEGYDDLPVGVAPNQRRRFLNCRGLSAAPAGNEEIVTSALADQNSGTIGGYIKIERQGPVGVWTDVTLEILNLGFGAPNQGGTICNDPTPTAVLRIQRLRDNGGGTVAQACTYDGSVNSWDWWPNALYDAREGTTRDVAATTPMTMSGVMQYIALDANNLRRWLTGAIGTTGTLALNNNGNGFVVYFSDRRGNHDAGNGDVETGEYGFEDHVNPASALGVPDGVMQAGEDLNVGSLPMGGVVVSGTQQLYGTTPWNNPVNIPPSAATAYNFTNDRPWTQIPRGNAAGGVVGAGRARVNKVVLFRRALKIINGGINAGVNNLPAPGLSVASENPVYVQGNFNATTDPTAEPNVAASIVADAITLLSNSWNDARSFEVPNSADNRNATSTGYRFAALAGKGVNFPYCAAACGSPGALFGTDGGAANFLRLLEDWGSAGGLNYRGSLISLHVNRQAIGTYKFTPGTLASLNVYNGGPRNFTFDIDFLTPALLPPATPMFRDINTLQFRQILRPNQ